ncbi:MAG: helix-turn-helix domain-containing protein [Eubacteriales bacterium]|nr:helix-turn-helix domain-containing protein [Eubacteriales bacterium]
MANNNNLTLKEVCQELGKSKRTITRYIKKGLLNPEKVKSENGILEYRFKKTEIENINNPDTTTSQTTRQNIKSESNNNDTLSLLKDNMKLLEKQLKAKDRQINKMLERQRETNILIGQLQNKVLLLEDKSKGKRQDKNDKPSDTTSDTLSDRVKRFIDRLLGKK